MMGAIEYLTAPFNRITGTFSGSICAALVLLYAILRLSAVSRPGPTPAGCKRLSSPQKSALADEFDTKHNSSPTAAPSARIHGLFVYPIKSCRGVEVTEIQVTEHGLKYDRDFMIAQKLTKEDDATNEKSTQWHFITLRSHPILAHVEINIWEPDQAVKGYSAADDAVVESEGCLEISFPRVARVPNFVSNGFAAVLANITAVISQRTLRPAARTSFGIPYAPTASQIKRLGLSRHQVKLFGDWPTGIDMSNCIPPAQLEELRQFLNVENPMTIFRKDPSVIRNVNGNANDIHDLGYRANTNFSDEFPINLLGIASVQDVASHLPKGFGKLSAARFRSNFLITGVPAFTEENWKSIQLYTATGDDTLLFHVTNRATRCTLPNVDPHQHDPSRPNVLKRGQFGYNEPFNTLRSYRAIDEGGPGKPCLGMMLVPAKIALGQKVKVGMEIQVKEEGKHVLKD